MVGQDDPGGVRDLAVATAANVQKMALWLQGVRSAGATLGEMSMLDGEPRNATCTAIEAVEAGVLTREAISGLIRDHPAVGAKLLVKLTQLIAQRLRNSNNQLVKLLQERASKED